MSDAVCLTMLTMLLCCDLVDVCQTPVTRSTLKITRENVINQETERPVTHLK